MVNNSTSLNKTNDHLSPQIIEDEKIPNWHMTLKIQVLALDRTKKVAVLNQLTASNHWPCDCTVHVYVVFWYSSAPKNFSIIWLSNLLTLRVPNEDYSRKVYYALNLLSTFLLPPWPNTYPCTNIILLYR